MPYLLSSALLGFGVGIVASIAYQKAVHHKVDYQRAFYSGLVGAAISIGTAGSGLATGAVYAGATSATQAALRTITLETGEDIVTSLALEALTDLDATSDVLREEREKESSICKKCYKILQVDERGQAIIVTFNEQGQEVSRSSSGGGGPGGGSTVRQTDDDRWVCNWCDDQGNEMPIEQD